MMKIMWEIGFEIIMMKEKLIFEFREVRGESFKLGRLSGKIIEIYLLKII